MGDGFEGSSSSSIRSQCELQITPASSPKCPKCPQPNGTKSDGRPDDGWNVSPFRNSNKKSSNVFGHFSKKEEVRTSNKHIPPDIFFYSTRELTDQGDGQRVHEFDHRDGRVGRGGRPTRAEQLGGLDALFARPLPLHLLRIDRPDGHEGRRSPTEATRRTARLDRRTAGAEGGHRLRMLDQIHLQEEKKEAVNECPVLTIRPNRNVWARASTIWSPSIADILFSFGLSSSTGK